MRVSQDILDGLKDSSYRAGALRAVIDSAADRLEGGHSPEWVAKYLRAWAGRCDAADIAREADSDGQKGMAWWNALSDDARTEWAKKAGNTGRAADAWELFKREGQPDATAEREARPS